MRRNPLSIQVCFNKMKKIEIEKKLKKVVIPYQFRSVSMGKHHTRLEKSLLNVVIPYQFRSVSIN